jgi:hypothetical protein
LFEVDPSVQSAALKTAEVYRRAEQTSRQRAEASRAHAQALEQLAAQLCEEAKVSRSPLDAVRWQQAELSDREASIARREAAVFDAEAARLRAEANTALTRAGRLPGDAHP